jgi:hypothetical protein
MIARLIKCKLSCMALPVRLIPTTPKVPQLTRRPAPPTPEQVQDEATRSGRSFGAVSAERGSPDRDPPLKFGPPDEPRVPFKAR